MPFKTSITLQGYSRAHELSCFSIPEWKLQFDAGEYIHHSSSSYARPTVIVVTNPHLDHSASLPITLIDPDLPIRVFVPAKALAAIVRFVETTYRMNTCGDPHEKVCQWLWVFLLKEHQRLRETSRGSSMVRHCKLMWARRGTTW